LPKASEEPHIVNEHSPAGTGSALIGEPGTVLFHYTSLDTAVRHILPTGLLRMNPFSEMRDPREYQRWRPIAAGYVPDADQKAWNEHSAQLEDRLNELKDRFKLLALTMDDPSDPSVYGRGFARSRLWESYGDRGKGVCLVFDKPMLIETLMPRLRGVGRPSRSGPVTYLNKRLSRELFFDVNHILSAGLDAAVENVAKTHLEALFFTKLTDWASEHEYRFVAATGTREPLYVDASAALRAVIMGYECAPGFFPALAELCRPRRVKIRQLKWFNVEPLLHGIALD
jgi:hypothetical protein